MGATPPMVGTDTYISVADATALAADRLNAGAWTAAVAAHEAEIAAAEAAAQDDGTTYVADDTVPLTCRQALVSATALLDRLAWSGEPVAPAPALAWPRTHARDNQGRRLASTDVPAALPIACAELAFHMLANERGGASPGNVQMEMVGQSMTTYFASVADELPPRVRLLVAPYLAVSSKHSAAVRF